MTDRTITSLTHPLVKHLVNLRESASYRDINNSVLIQGSKLVKELGARECLRLLVVAHIDLIPAGIQAAEIVIATEGVLQKISGVMTTEGVVAEVNRPVWHALEGFKKVLALDGISDPGNLGTLIRTALALGWDGIYLLEGCCDPYNDKALRSAMGATFCLPMARGSWPALKELAGIRGWTPVVGDLDGIVVDEMMWDEGILLVLGNEAKGISETARLFCRAITIPMPGTAESLNVAIAGAILMYILGRNGP